MAADSEAEAEAAVTAAETAAATAAAATCREVDSCSRTVTAAASWGMMR